MLKNERRANQIIKDNMGDLAASMTVNNETVKRLSESLKASERGVAAKFWEFNYYFISRNAIIIAMKFYSLSSK